MPWKIGIISIHPTFLESYKLFGVFRSALEHSILELNIINLRDFSADKHASVDDTPYGGGDGMVMRPDCLANAVEHIWKQWGHRSQVVLTSPGTPLWTHKEADGWAKTLEPTVFICGRFAGVDQRFIDSYVTHQFSVGDVVLAGGELPVLMMIESILRFLPGVLGHSESANRDSFGTALNGRLEHPQYTRPPSWNGQDVPPVLLSGNHKEIELWRSEQSAERTLLLRPDLSSR